MIPEQFPDRGMGEDAAYELFSKAVSSKSTELGNELFFAHMDPPTPEISSKLVGLNAGFNQNMLHPDLSPLASGVETRLIQWFAEAFGMGSGHMCGGSTLGNLTALWAAREGGARKVVASSDAHLSVSKSAHILGMTYEAIDVDLSGKLQRAQLPDLSDAALVLTAGTTGRGAIDDLESTDALWTHVDAAWAAPLMFTKHAPLLDGIETADSIAISCHKWLYQPKESAMVLFSDPAAQEAIGFGGSYLTVPNVGVQGSRSASAIPLMAMLMAWGKEGLAKSIERDMTNAQKLATIIDDDPRTQLKQAPTTGIISWRAVNKKTSELIPLLKATSSSTSIGNETWMRQVAANPHVNIEKVWDTISHVLDS